jgi:hypothetical protein
MTRDPAPTATERDRKPAQTGGPSAGERPDYLTRTRPWRSLPDLSRTDEADSETEQPEYMIRTRPTQNWPSARGSGSTGSV